MNTSSHDLPLEAPRRQDAQLRFEPQHLVQTAFADYRRALQLGQDIFPEAAPGHLAQQIFRNVEQAQPPTQPLSGKPTLAIKRTAIQAGGTFVSRKRTKLEEALQPRHGYSEFQIELAAPHSSHNARYGKKLTVEERAVRDKGACIMCRSRKWKCVRSYTEGPCDRCARALVVGGSEVNSIRLLACVTRLSELPSIDSCEEAGLLLCQLEDAWYLQVGQWRLLTLEDLLDLEKRNRQDGSPPRPTALMQRCMPYAQSLLAYLDPLSGARWLQALTTERIDEAVDCLIVIALLHTALDFDATMEPHRDIFEHYWTLVTKRLNMFASDRHIGDAVVETLIVDSRARLAVSKGATHQAETLKQRARDSLAREVDLHAPDGVGGQIHALWEVFVFPLPSEEGYPASNDYSESEYSEFESLVEIDDEGIWICPDCSSENVDDDPNANSSWEDDEDEELSRRDDAEDEEKDAEVGAQSDNGFARDHDDERILICSTCGLENKDAYSNSSQRDDEDEDFSASSTEDDDEGDVAILATFFDGSPSPPDDD